MEKQIIEYVEESPFAIVEQNKEYIIILGNQIVSEKKFKNKTEAKKYIKSQKWDLIGSLLLFTIKNIEKFK